MSDGNTTTAAAATSSDCPVVGFLPFTMLGDGLVGRTIDGKAYNWPYTHLAAAVLAADHFNERNPVVTPELATEPYMENCTVQFPTPIMFSNTNGDHTVVTKFLIDEAYAQNRYCAIVGPYTNTPAIEAAKVAAGMRIPMVTHGADDNGLTSVFVNPQAARTAVNLHAMGEVVVNWFRSHGRTDFLATIAVVAEFGDQFRQTVDNAAKEAGFRHHEYFVIAPPWEGFEVNRGVGYALQGIRNLGFRNIFLALNNPAVQIPFIADYAEQFEMNQGDHVWGVSGNIDFGELAYMASQNANISKLVNGMGALRVVDGFTYRPETDAFLQVWKEQNATTVDRINDLHPIQNVNATGYYHAEPDYFQTELPQQGAAFMYDAVMSVGLGKCLFEQREELEAPLADEQENSADGVRRKNRRRIKGQQAKRQEQRQLQKGKKGVDTTNSHINAIFDLDFEGASGRIAFGENGVFSPGSRQRGTVTYGAYNFRSVNNDAMNPNVTTWYHLTDYLQGSTTEPNWTQTDLSPFVFSSGLSTPPPLNRDLPEQNYLSPAIQATGLAFMALALAITLTSTFLVYHYEDSPSFRQGQPAFLYVLMLGAFTMSWGIFTISFDESFGWTENMLDAACVTTPWLISVGYMTMYLAMFSKLWRVNKVLQFRRRQVMIRHVVGPFIGVLLAAIAVLLTWTLLDPFTWERQVVDDFTGESYGRCHSEHEIVFVTALIILMAISTFACAFMAFKCREIDSRFQESNWIFYTIFLQIQVLLVGIPVLVILQDASADATYLGRSLVIFVVVMTNVVLMIWPKAFVALGIVTLGPANQSSNNSKAQGSVSGGGSALVSGVVLPSGARSSAISGLSNSAYVSETRNSCDTSTAGAFRHDERSSLGGISEDDESEDFTRMTAPSTSTDPSRSGCSSLASSRASSTTIRNSRQERIPDDNDDVRPPWSAASRASTHDTSGSVAASSTGAQADDEMNSSSNGDGIDISA